MNIEQLRAILWLRWRLTRNQLLRGSGLNAAVAALLLALLVVVALGAGLGAILLGALVLKQASAQTVMLAWDGVIFVTLCLGVMSIVTELQRSESIEIKRLLHLPIALRQVFIFNYLASLVSIGTALVLALMLGLGLGQVISRGPDFLLILPLVLASGFMITAWFYALRGWLLSLMINPRRRRAIIIWMTLAIIVLGQAPQLLNFLPKSSEEPEPPTRTEPGASPARSQPRSHTRWTSITVLAAKAHPWIPLLWLPNGARGLATGEILPALWGTIGMGLLGWVGLSRSYRATLRFYRADEPSRQVRIQAAPTTPVPSRRNWVEVRLPGLREDTAAMLLMQFRSLSRAPEVRMTLGLGLFVAVFLPLVIFARGGKPAALPEPLKPFFGTIAVALILFSLLQLVCNQFGFDRDGFRSLVLLPTPRERLLFGRNLALLPFAGAIALVPIAAASWIAKLPVLLIAATGLQFIAAFILFCGFGNLASILVPYRMSAGSLKPSKQSFKTFLAVMAVQLLFPVLISIVFVPPLVALACSKLGPFPAAPLNLLGTLFLLGALGALYRASLAPLGRLLQRRETKILQAVTEAQE